jgi:predicted RND superfamily exporter protein
MLQRELIRQTVRLKFKPCLYAALTTIAGFGSLVLCDILPVINFGWMMIGGLIISLIMTFLVIPTGLMLLKKGPPPVFKSRYLNVTAILARFTQAHGTKILLVSCLILIISVAGISRLEVENSFIDYFKKSTEIYQGMKIIDEKMGGTTPLDVVIDMAEADRIQMGDSDQISASDDDFDTFGEFDDAEDDAQYWFTVDKMAKILAIHDYLEGLPETGKVLSLGTFLKIAQNINDGKPLDNFMLALLHKEIPDRFRKIVLDPYVSVAENQVRFSVRVRDSDKDLHRNELLNRIRSDLSQKFELDQNRVHLAGLLVLYNNMLQSLFNSQIITLGITLLVLMVMFFILFRSLRLALIAVFPNIVSIAVVLGTMGWFEIPLDMMTITIAAISIGIAVDNAIHYIHRFSQEFAVDRNYLNTMHRCHGSIGKALYYTSLTIIMGFSILTLSNFIPSIYFGLLTGLAMLIALTAALTLLPQLLLFIRPFGPEAVIPRNVK